MAITIKALGNYSKVPFIYVNSGVPVQGNTGVSAEENDVITLYSEVHPSYTGAIYGFYAIKKVGNVYDYIQLSPTETTPGQIGSGFKKAYTVDSTMISFVADGYEIYAIPEVDLTGLTTYNFYRVGYYTTLSDIKNITKAEQGLVYYNTEERTYTEYFFANLFLSQFPVLADSLVYFRTITDPITEGDYAGYSVVFDYYGSAPAEITQPSLVFDEYTFEQNGYSVNQLPADTYINMGTIEYGYSPQIILKYGEAPTSTTHTVTFYDYDEEVLSKIEVEDGQAIPQSEIPDAPEREDYEFQYWYYWSKDVKRIKFDFDTPITEALELHPRYLAVFTVTYIEEDRNTGDTYETEVQVLEGQKAPKLEPKNSVYIEDDDGFKLPYVFVYWSTDEEYGFDFNEGIYYDTTLYAMYKIGGNKYWKMCRNNCLVGLQANIDYIPLTNVETGTRAMALSDDGVKYYTFYKGTWYPDVAEE